MAVFFRGMTARETQHLTAAMMRSGRVLEYPAGFAAESRQAFDRRRRRQGFARPRSPARLRRGLGADDFGRGLGITGGTLDKLESIPGFNVSLDEERALQQLERIGVFMIGQTADICPADKKLYALRDVTGTVPSQPLIVASIMSKKLAENLDRLVLDVKFGSGAFMKTRAEAEQLARSMTEVGELMGVQMSCLLNPMDEPLGRAVGNALEVAECVEILQGGGPDDLITLILDLAAKVSSVSRDQLAAVARGRQRLAEICRAGRGAGRRRFGRSRRSPRSIARRLFSRCPRRGAGTYRKWTRKRSAARRFCSAAAGKRPTTRSISRSAFRRSRKSAKRSRRRAADDDPCAHEDELASVLPLLRQRRGGAMTTTLAGLRLAAACAHARRRRPRPKQTSADARPRASSRGCCEGKEELNADAVQRRDLYATGKKVLAIDPQRSKPIAASASRSAPRSMQVVRRMNAADSPVQSVARINEVSAPFENMLRELLNSTRA